MTDVTALQQRKKMDFPSMLKASFGEVARALPKHLNPDRMSRIALTAFRRTPKLGQCDPRSVIAAVIQASQLGLEPDTLGRAYLIPYGNECQFIPGWKGLVELANRSGQSDIWTGAVFQGDKFDYSLGSSPHIEHKPMGEYDPQLLQYVYAVGRTKGSEWPVIEVWPIERVYKHRDRYNKVGKGHYSFNNLEMYARKVVLLQVLKYMPMSPDLVTAVELDNAATTGEQHLDIDDAIEGVFEAVQNEEQEQEPDAKPAGKTSKKKASKKKTSKKPVDPLESIIASMQAAGSADMLAEAREEGNDPDLGLDDVQKLRLDDVFHNCMEKLRNGSDANSGFGDIE